MKKLKKFNALYNKLIFESSQQQQRIQNLIRDYKTFFTEYIQPLAIQCQLLAQINRYNTFRISGKVENVYKFLTNFKVDQKFKQKDEKFQIISPLVTFGDIRHLYNNGQYNKYFNRTFSEGNQLIDAGNNQTTTRAVDDMFSQKIEGRWYNLFNNTQKNQNVPDYNVPKRLKKCTPEQLKNVLQKFVNFIIGDIKNVFICLQFVVNCDKIMNSYDNDTTSISITYSGKDNKILDVADTMNNEDKIEYLSDSFIKPSEDVSLVGDTKKIIRKTKQINYNIKNKTKTTKK